MIGELDVLDASGDLRLTWDPDQPAEVAKAKAEFERLKGCGYAFFVRDEARATSVKRLGKSGVLDVEMPIEKARGRLC